MSISAKISRSGPDRSFERTPVSATAALRRGMQRGSVEVHDLSTHGARIVALNPLSIGDQIWLTFPMLEALQVTVMWVKGFEAGCKFAKPLHPAVLQVLLQKTRRG